MKLGEAKKRALSLMAEYSIDGVLIPEGENADYLNRMSRFANDAQFEISEKVPIEASFFMEQVADNKRDYVRYELPADFKEPKQASGNNRPMLNYHINGGNISIPAAFNGSFELIYYKYPRELNSETPDDYEFEVDKHAQQIIPYYMGGMALADENAGLADRLLNMYYGKLQSLYKRHNQYPDQIIPVYHI